MLEDHESEIILKLSRTKKIMKKHKKREITQLHNELLHNMQIKAFNQELIIANLIDSNSSIYAKNNYVMNWRIEFQLLYGFYRNESETIQEINLEQQIENFIY